MAVQKTTGDIPPRSTVIAQIVGDQMYTLKVRSGHVVDLVVLDLTSWVWKRLKPEGYTPLPCGARGAIHTKTFGMKNILNIFLRYNFYSATYVQRWAKKWSLGCVSFLTCSACMLLGKTGPLF